MDATLQSRVDQWEIVQLSCQREIFRLLLAPKERPDDASLRSHAHLLQYRR